MVTRTRGQPLQTFTGIASPKHEIGGPGENAYKVIDDDQTTYLVAPGVIDCMVLTVMLPGTGNNGALRARALAHYNNFGGPYVADLKKLFDSIRNTHGVQDSELLMAISHHTGARGTHCAKLGDLVGEAAPGLESLTLHAYGDPPKDNREKRVAVTIYLSPVGQIRGAQ
jgi:hypothetical protein